MNRRTKIHFVTPKELQDTMPEHMTAFTVALRKIKKRWGEKTLRAAMAGVNHRQIMALLNDVYDVPDHIIHKVSDNFIELLKLIDGIDPDEVTEASQMLDKVVLAARKAATVEDDMKEGAGAEKAAELIEAVIEKSKGAT